MLLLTLRELTFDMKAKAEGRSDSNPTHSYTIWIGIIYMLIDKMADGYPWDRLALYQLIEIGWFALIFGWGINLITDALILKTSNLPEGDSPMTIETAFTFDMKPIRRFLDFCKGKPTTRAYIEVGPFENLYVRKGFHALGGVGQTCFDIAKIENTENPSQGMFWLLVEDLKIVIKEYGINFLYVENVHGRRFQVSLLKRGWIQQENQDHDATPSFYLEIK